MGPLDIIQILSAAWPGPATAQADSPFVIAALSFSPVRLIGLVVWVYLCLYLVQVVQFSPLVPDNRKSIAVMATFIAGPMLLLALHGASQSCQSRRRPSAKPLSPEVSASATKSSRRIVLTCVRGAIS